MKKYVPLALLFVFLMVFCGAPQEGPKPEAKKAGADVMYETLGENELQRMIKAVPVFVAEMEKLEKEWESPESPEALGAWVGQLSMLHKELPELDAKLTSAGMPWNEFWPAFAKTQMAIAAMMMDSLTVEMKKQAKDTEMAKEMIKQMEEAGAIYKDVPQGNKDLVKKYWQELVKVFEME